MGFSTPSISAGCFLPGRSPFFVAMLLAALLAPAAPAQIPEVRFAHLTVSDGLSHNEVLSIFQDRHGYLWFGTLDGLNRYDGHRFTIFQNLPMDSTSLAGDVVYAIREDRAGTLWVGTSGGLNRFDPETGVFRHYLRDRDFATEPWANDVGSLYIDRTGTLWAGTFGGGLYRLDPATGTLTHFAHDPDDPATLNGDVVEAIREDQAGAVWVSTNNGLARFEAATGRFTRYLNWGDPLAFQRQAPPPDDDPLILDFLEMPGEPGVFWVSTINGLSRFVPGTGEVRQVLRYDILPEQKERGVWWSMPQSLIHDPWAPHVLWVVSLPAGLYRYDTETGEAVRYAHDHDAPNSLSAPPNCLYADEAGIIWVGSDRGLSRFDASAMSFTLYRAVPGAPALTFLNVTALHEDRYGVLWVGSGDFLYGTYLRALDGRAGTYRQWQADPSHPRGLSQNIGVRTIYEDRSGTLWVGTEPRVLTDVPLHRFDRSTGTFVRYPLGARAPGGQGTGAVVQLLEDRQGVFWVATSRGGLGRMDRSTGRVQFFRHTPGDPRSLPGNEIRALFEDQAGVLWVATGEGLSRFDRSAETFVTYRHDPEDANSLSSSSVFSLHERAREPGVLWVGTGTALDRFVIRTETARHFAEEEGFPGYPVVGILEDAGGQLWMSTSGAGLLRFDPSTGAVQPYDDESGLQSRRFNPGVAFKSRSGTMYFGGSNGFNGFDPRRMQGNTTPPRVLLTDVKLFGRSLPVGGTSPLQRPLAETRELRLRHDQQVVSFEFAALHYKHPTRNRFAYRLEGFDDDWVQAGTQRTATYTNLDPGTYTFHVRAANSDGVWNEEGVSLRLVVLPPWWRAPWAYAFYILLLLAGIYGANQVQRRRLIAQEQERAHQSLAASHQALQSAHEHLKATQAQLVQQEKMASLGALTAGIAHEIKNPLNFVNNFAQLTGELVDEVRAEREAHPERPIAAFDDVLSQLELNASKIEEHGRRADGIIRSMLLHSRGTTGQRQRTDLNGLLEEYINLAYHGMRAQYPGFNVTIHRRFDPHLEPAEVVPQEVGRVFINLLTNAFYATYLRSQSDGAGFDPQVTVTTRPRGDEVEVSIADNGPGIPEDLREKIFEPFFTTKPVGEGTGLGLSMAYDIVTQGHGGTFGVESREGEGATFTLTLPVQYTPPAGATEGQGTSAPGTRGEVGSRKTPVAGPSS